MTTTLEAAPTVAAPSAPTSIKTADYVNPIIQSTRDVFEMMLGCVPKRTGLMRKQDAKMPRDISGVIGISGKTRGTIVLCFPKASALEALHRMIGTVATDIDDDVCDAVGELTNMIAGAAKAQMAHLELSISLPNIVCGEDHVVRFPATSVGSIEPFCVLFDSDLGPFMIEVAFA